jgi:hypothetical protein
MSEDCDVSVGAMSTTGPDEPDDNERIDMGSNHHCQG